MNKQQLVDAVGERLGDRTTAATAVDAVLSTVSGALAEGERVSLFGFGVFHDSPQLIMGRSARRVNP